MPYLSYLKKMSLLPTRTSQPRPRGSPEALGALDPVLVNEVRLLLLGQPA